MAEQLGEVVSNVLWSYVEECSFAVRVAVAAQPRLLRAAGSVALRPGVTNVNMSNKQGASGAGSPQSSYAAFDQLPAAQSHHVLVGSGQGVGEQGSRHAFR